MFIILVIQFSINKKRKVVDEQHFFLNCTLKKKYAAFFNITKKIFGLEIGFELSFLLIFPLQPWKIKY